MTRITQRKANWIGQIGQNWRGTGLVKHIIRGKINGRIEVTERRGRRRRKLLVDLKEKRGYWNSKELAIDRTVWRTGCVKTDCRMNGIDIRGRFLYQISLNSVEECTC